MANDIVRSREEYLKSLSPEEKAIKLAMWAKKSAETRKANAEVKKSNDMVGDRVRECLNLPFVKLDDGTEETINDYVISSALANLTKSELSIKDLLDLKKLTEEKDEVASNEVKIIFNTNGQDLGD